MSDTAKLFVSVMCPNCPDVALEDELNGTITCYMCHGIWKQPTIELERLNSEK